VLLLKDSFSVPSSDSVFVSGSHGTRKSTLTPEDYSVTVRLSKMLLLRAGWVGKRYFHGSEFVPLKAHGELRRSAAHYPAKGNQTQRNSSIQHARPLDAHFHQCTLHDLVPGVHQDAAAANIDGTACARETGSLGKIVETNPQVDGVAILYAALGLIGPVGGNRLAKFCRERENSGY
jgi:hypothetical protein